MELRIKLLEEDFVTIGWDAVENADSYRVYWADKDTPQMCYRLMAETAELEYTLHKASHVPHYLKVAAVEGGVEKEAGPVLSTPVKKVFREQMEKLGRGLVAVPAANGIFLSWRMFRDEVCFEGTQGCKSNLSRTYESAVARNCSYRIYGFNKLSHVEERNSNGRKLDKEGFNI